MESPLFQRAVLAKSLPYKKGQMQFFEIEIQKPVLNLKVNKQHILDKTLTFSKETSVSEWSQQLTSVGDEDHCVVDTQSEGNIVNINETNNL